jgi:glutaredoxin 3
MKIETYTAPTCPWCTKLKEWLKKKKLSYEDKDVSESQNKIFRDELIEKSGQLGVPVIDIDGKIIVGFDEKALEKATKT